MKRPGYLSGYEGMKPRGFSGAPGPPGIGPNIPGPPSPGFQAPITPPGGLFRAVRRLPANAYNPRPHILPNSRCASCG